MHAETPFLWYRCLFAAAPGAKKQERGLRSVLTDTPQSSLPLRASEVLPKQSEVAAQRSFACGEVGKLRYEITSLRRQPQLHKNHLKRRFFLLLRWCCLILGRAGNLYGKFPSPNRILPYVALPFSTLLLRVFNYSTSLRVQGSSGSAGAAGATGTAGISSSSGGRACSFL